MATLTPWREWTRDDAVVYAERVGLDPVELGEALAAAQAGDHVGIARVSSLLTPAASAPAPSRPRFYIQSAPEFLAEVDPPEEVLVGELVTAGRTVLLHGEPRARKSWAALELMVAAATQTPAFGLERFAVPAAIPVWGLFQEDGRRDVRRRLRRHLEGRGRTEAPAGLYLSVHASIDLEDQEWQDTVIRDAKERGVRMVVFDPIRRFAAAVDKGPAEVRAVTAFLRRLTVEAGAAVVTVHHDVKPGREQDNRRRSHRASGGDWFAASDCPIHLEPAGNRTLVVPSDFKFGADPASFTFEIEEDEEQTWVRLVAQDVAGDDVTSVALHERLLEYLRHNAGASGSSVARGVQGSKQSVLEGLRTLEAAGKVDSVKSGRAIRWMVAEP